MTRLILATLILVASAGSVGAGDAFIVLAPGESAPVQGGDLEVGFVGVPSLGGYRLDSRCPLQVMCVWEGDAAMDLWVEDGAGSRAEFRLHTSPMEGDQSFRFGSTEFLLIRLTPHPVYPGDIEPDEYRVELLAVPAPRVPTEGATVGELKGHYRD